MAQPNVVEMRKPVIAEDDGVREIHGLKLGSEFTRLVGEAGGHVVLLGVVKIYLTPTQARYVARKLYHLARRVERREVGNE